MGKPSKFLVLGLSLVLVFLPLPLDAQTVAKGPADTNALAASPSLSGQAPDDMTAKMTELVHAGKYAEAQQLTAGLLIAYPNDQRLIKAKALIEKTFSSASQAAPGSQLAANPNPEQLMGMEKVDYNALIVLAREAMQTADLAEQKKLLFQFMNESSPFLQRHSDEALLWQLRAAAAISLNDPMAGYEAGQKLIASGATDRADPNLQQLLAQLKNKHWLDKQQAENAARQSKYDWLLGSVSGHFTHIDRRGHQLTSGRAQFEFSRPEAIIEGRYVWHGKPDPDPSFRITILDSGDIRCEGTEVEPVQSCEIDSVKQALKMVVTDPTNKEFKGSTRHWELKPGVLQ